MSIKLQGNGKYLLNFRPDGIGGKQIKKLFSTKHSALSYQKKILSEGLQSKIIDTRKFNELLELWYSSHGVTLKTSIDTKNRLMSMSSTFPKKSANLLHPSDFIFYRTSRLHQGIKPATLNRELATLNSMFNELYRMGHIDYSNPFASIRRLKEKKVELSYLSHEQIELLYNSVSQSSNNSLYFVVQICLSTGARWSEAQSITLKNIKNGGLDFLDTKNGKNRYIPICKSVEIELTEFLANNQNISNCYSAFRSALDRSGIDTPEGQCAHILRHTYTSHFLMNGGDILTLQKILGHSSLLVTSRYAHLAPDFLQDAIRYNPLEFKKK